MQREIISDIEKTIIRVTGEKLKIRIFKPVGGGSINQTFKAETTHGNYFVKLNNAVLFPGMFESEVHGLCLLKQANAVATPALVGSGETNGKSFLILKWIEPGKRVKKFFEDFGQRLAKLHTHTEKHFGLDMDNYIGSLVQKNEPRTLFSDFFIRQRLEVQLKMAIHHNRLPAGICKQFERLYLKLDEIIPAEKPSLLHGDLWSGNYMTGPDGGAIIFDPAVYYGHRESDLAMTFLFGGFDQEFYESYQHQFPLEKGWQKRAVVFNLYPLLVHVNLFGGGYAAEVMRILQRY
jgi:fructosamine-3-kinase